MEKMTQMLSRVQAHDPMEGGELQELYAMRNERDYNVHADNVLRPAVFSVEKLEKYFGTYYGILMQERNLIGLTRGLTVKELI